MELSRFTLGVRFDFLKDEATDEDGKLAFSELTKLLCVKDVEGLKIWAGVFKLNERDSGGIYTVVFTNGSLKTMRALYSKINNDARIHAMLDQRTPFIQHNTARRFANAVFFGCVGSDGVCAGGEAWPVRFGKTPEKRKLYDKRETIVAAPNSFKRTLSAYEVCRSAARAIRKHMPDITVLPVPLADGGDGTLEAVEYAVNGTRHSADVTAPYGNKVKAEYLVIDGTKAVIESARASGLALCGETELDPLKATSRGTGELIARAVGEGLKEIFVCLGGSASNDCGVGLAEALGVRFLDANDQPVTEASRLSEAAAIDVSRVNESVRQARIYAVCDVNNPLTGINGATYTFGPQKGADENALAVLEKGMINMERLLDSFAGKPVCAEPGSGAAGGMGAALISLFGAEVVSGSEALMQLTEFDSKLSEAALVITGEGRVDSTTLSGKAVGEVVKRAEKAGVPCALLCGSRGEGAELIENMCRFTEYSGSETEALKHLDLAAERLAEKIADR